MGQYSTTDAAKKLGMNARTVKRLCKDLRLGELVGGVRILSDDDMAALKPHKGRIAGNPEWIEAGRDKSSKAKSTRKKR